MLGRVVSHESNGAKVTIIRNDRRGLGSSLACALRQEAINPVDGNCVFPDSQWSLWAGLPAMAASRSTNLLRLYPINCRSEHAREKPESTAWCQDPRVIVDLHREQACSYKGPTHRESSVPCGFSSDGLPIELQVITARLCDEQVLSVLSLYTSASNHASAGASDKKLT